MRIVNLDNIEYMYREVETTEYKVLEYDVSTTTFETFEDTYQLQETGPLVFSYIIDNRLYFQYEKGDCMSIDLSGEEKYIYTKEKEQLDQLIHALHPEFQSNHTRIIPMGKNFLFTTQRAASHKAFYRFHSAPAIPDAFRIRGYAPYA